ncbi:MAG TPA: DegQ family serine endoprotease [Candidatus Limnocylindrales bacterium]|nr:DegQ family serine endoprotease [Candidatus Limnocylindrales bacterium]
MQRGMTLGAMIVGAVVGASAMAVYRDIPPSQIGRDAAREFSRAAETAGEMLGAERAFAHYPSVDLADVAERSMASVVNISTTKVSKMSEEDHPFFSDPFFRRFFESPQGRGIPRERRSQSLGSGVIVSEDGIILTSNHVVEQSDEIKVTTSDNREYDAEIVGSDPQSDLAVVRLKGKFGDLQPLPWGESSKLRLADTVLAIGNPFGVGQTVTMGIVSATGRANLGITDYEDFIQTDAAINPGNSGGALINIRGELVGINTAIVSRTGGNQGIGFAIPSDMARSIMDSLVQTGKVNRGWLGVAIQPLDRDISEALGIDQGQGVLIADVTKGSPAEEAGLKRGDVVLSVNGRAVRSTGELRNLVAAAGAGGEVEIEVLREKERETFTVELGAQPKNMGRRGMPNGEDEEDAESDSDAEERDAPDYDNVLSGLRVDDITDETRARFQVPKKIEEGALVTGVDRSSIAGRAGIRPGDVIVEADRKPVGSADDFEKIARKVKKDASVLLLVARQDGTAFVLVKP